MKKCALLIAPATGLFFGSILAFSGEKLLLLAPSAAAPAPIPTETGKPVSHSLPNASTVLPVTKPATLAPKTVVKPLSLTPAAPTPLKPLPLTPAAAQSMPLQASTVSVTVSMQPKVAPIPLTLSTTRPIAPAAPVLNAVASAVPRLPVPSRGTPTPTPTPSAALLVKRVSTVAPDLAVSLSPSTYNPAPYDLPSNNSISTPTSGAAHPHGTSTPTSSGYAAWSYASPLPDASGNPILEPFASALPSPTPTTTPEGDGGSSSP